MSHYIGADIEKEGVLPGYRRNTSIARVLVDALRKNGDSTALLEAHTGKKASFRELLQQSTNIAAGLRDLGISAGDYVIICCDKSILAYSLVLGVLYTGATVVLPPIPHADIVHKLARGHPIKAVICDTTYLDALTISMNQMNTKPSYVITTDPGDKILTTLLKPFQGEFQVYESKDIRTHISMIFFSSGTTGEPKGIQLTDIAVQLVGVYFLHKFKQFLIASPLYWLSAFFPFTSSIFNKYTVVLNNSREPLENLAVLQKYKIDGWFTSTGSMGRYIREPRLKEFDISSVKRAFVAGESVLGSVANQFMETVLGGRVKLEIVNGSTEAGMLSCFNYEQTYDKVRVGECGRVYDGVEIKILDEKGNVVPVGSLGKVWIRSVSMTPGYWGRPELNQENWDKEGFFDSGDAGFFDKDFNLFFRGRVPDLINYRGKKIPPNETEDVISTHPEVLDTAVVGTPHPVDIQHMTAFVELKPGATVTSSQLLEFVNSRVDDERKLLGGLHILEILPRTVIGKVIRKRLREHKTS